jgi:hypothetical protein
MPLDFPSNPTDGQVYEDYYYDATVGVWNSLGNSDIPNILSNGVFTASSGTAVPITVNGASGQSANLQEWKSQAGATLASMSANGGLSLNTPLSVQNGGTGTSSLTLDGYLKGTGTSAITSQSGIPAGDITSGQLASARMPSGSVLQVVYTRYQGRPTFAFSSTDTIISYLNTTITPKSSTSLLIAQYQISGELTYNAVFRGYRDGSLITTTNYWGYNQEDGNAWSGIAVWPYDNDLASTPSTVMMQYAVPSGSTAATTLQIAVKSSTNESQTFYLNRTYGSAGASAYEIMVSNVVVWEIAQ